MDKGKHSNNCTLSESHKASMASWPFETALVKLLGQQCPSRSYWHKHHRHPNEGPGSSPALRPFYPRACALPT